MENIDNLVEEWNRELYININDIKTDYNDLLFNVKTLAEFKFEPYQPIISPPQKKFFDRLYEWLSQFEEEEQKYLFYLASKILFFNQKQINHLCVYIYERCIKKIILEDIIEEKNLKKYDYKEARSYYKAELEKTLFVGLTDSSRIIDFSHYNHELVRSKNFHFSLETLLYPTKRRLELLIFDDYIALCKDFEEKILNSDVRLKEKQRLIIIEDFCGSGSDFIQRLELLTQSNLNFKKIIFAPYLITYKALENIQEWEDSHTIEQEFKLVYGEILPIGVKCFDQNDNYLISDWIGTEDISNKIKENCEKKYNEYNFDSLDYHNRFGFNNIKLAVVSYYNCPDNSLPIIWIDDNGWIPLFRRSRRYL